MKKGALVKQGLGEYGVGAVGPGEIRIQNGPAYEKSQFPRIGAISAGAPCLLWFQFGFGINSLAGAVDGMTMPRCGILEPI